jgi:DNA replication protein DnaC
MNPKSVNVALSGRAGVVHAGGSFRKRLALLTKVDLLILDDYGMKAMTQESKTDLLEVIESRMERRSTLITSQVPMKKWHDYLSEGNSTVADAILDRLVSGAIRIILRGESMRK